jgi:hypothetical protein
MKFKQFNAHKIVKKSDQIVDINAIKDAILIKIVPLSLAKSLF